MRKTGHVVVIIVLVAALGICATTLAGLLKKPFSSRIDFVEASSYVAAIPPPPKAPLSGENILKLAFVGDIMQHREQMDNDFQAAYERLKPILSSFDLVVGNLEFPVDPNRPVGPPPLSARFNGSVSHIEALGKAGFEVMITANNHSFDQGLEGALSTLDVVREAGMQAVGTGEEFGDLNPVIIEVDGIKIAIVAYTFRPNFYRDASDNFEYWERSWPINELNFNDWTEEYREEGLDMFGRHVQAAEDASADLLVAYAHWGEEWRFHPTDDQKLAARDMIDAGFDLVIGSHSHVLNPPEIYDGKLIAYSLGNLISAFAPIEVRTGAILEVEIGITESSEPRLRSFQFIPTVTEQVGDEKPDYVVLPLSRHGRPHHEDSLKFVEGLLGEGAVRVGG